MSGATTAEQQVRRAGWVVLAIAILIAAAGALPYAGSWNDGSRLAAVESIVDRHTLRIDDSIFVRVPAPASADAPTPYPRDDLGLMANGTGDRIMVNGHFYSGKPPVPTLGMAALYSGLQSLTGLRAAARPDLFCYLITLGSAGLAYVLAVWCIFRLGGPLGLALPLRLTITASFALSTVALAYTRHVSNHIIFLGVSSLLVLSLAWLGRPDGERAIPFGRILAVGILAGLGYAVDVGAGLVLLFCTTALVVYRCRKFQPLLLFGLGAFPWIALHHVVNYAISGTFSPADSHPEYFRWAGSSLDESNMVGMVGHPGIVRPAVYALELLVGKNGFFGYNLPLFAVPLAAWVLARRRTPYLPELAWAACWCGGTWLLCSIFSNNHGGTCASIRWFVPLLAPCYFLLALFLRDHPERRRDFILLSAWGAFLAVQVWWQGPWMKHVLLAYWPVQVAALLTYLYCRSRWRRESLQNGPQLAGAAA